MYFSTPSEISISHTDTPFLTISAQNSIYLFIIIMQTSQLHSETLNIRGGGGGGGGALPIESVLPPTWFSNTQEFKGHTI